MYIFDAILLLGLVAFTAASPHDCDPFAANTGQKEGAEAGDQVIKLEKFSEKRQLTFIVTEATPSDVDGSSEFCTAATHGDKCEAVRFFRKITQVPAKNSEKGAKDLAFDLVFVGVSGTTGKAIKYEMKVEGINEDDYIFQLAPNTEIKVTEYTKKGEEKSVTTAAKVSEVLKSPFALFYTSEKGGGFSLYITCDGESMWLAYDKSSFESHVTNSVIQKELNDQVEKLKDIAYKHKQTEPTLEAIKTDIIPEFAKLIPIPAAA